MYCEAAWYYGKLTAQEAASLKKENEIGGFIHRHLIIPNLEHWHKKERMCKEPSDTKTSG